MLHIYNVRCCNNNSIFLVLFIIIIIRKKMSLEFFLWVTLILISSGQIQGESSKCSYPYSKVGPYCYYISTSAASWDEAYVKCVNKGGYLANIETFNEFMVLRSWIAGLNSGHHYSIGGREIQDGDWRWVKDGDSFMKMSHYVFGPTEPNGSKSRPEKCTALYTSVRYYVVDLSCNSVTRYICEK
ncbi:perlucin-like protein [Crassostrea angulata]|uniref:perlucin-like protein n=1 Tax=Magallana angulata TaxID=2784310 RepID=UPI0022B20F9C|nr:perlucin-like protein [Crassostrea angulata]